MRTHPQVLGDRTGIFGLCALGLVGAVVASTLVLAPSRANAGPGEYYVAPHGDDEGPGTIHSPWATVEKGLTSLEPGDTLYLREGTYVEQIKNPEVSDGTSTSRITLKAYPGERPVIQGLFRIKGADYWTYEGVNVTWDLDTGKPGQYMVKLKGGTGWVFTKAELWGAHSKGALRVAGDATDWTVSWLYVHDTYPTNEEDEDDLILVSAKDGGGVIERCLLVNSENGRAVRIGPTKEGGNKTANVTVRYNTMYNNRGPSNVHFFYSAHDNLVHRNIMVRTEGPGDAHVKKFVLTGEDNVTSDNVGWLSEDVVGNDPLVDGGGNLLVDPRFADPARGDFRPTNPRAADYGVYASEDSPGEQEGTPYQAFSETSYWNTPLPADAPIDPRSGGFIDYLKGNVVGDFVMLSGATEEGLWAPSIYWADPGHPEYDVVATEYDLPPEFATLRIPPGAEPGPSTDHEMIVYDVDRGYVAGLWLAEYDAGSDTWSAGGGDVYYLASNGLAGKLPQSDDSRNQGHRGVPPPTFTIRWDEIEAGQIEHVLKVAIPNPGSGFVFPMTGSDGDSDDPDAPPEGARFRLKPSIDLDSMDLTPAQYAIATAAQDYGFIVGDGSGAPVSLSVENVVAEGRGWLWEGVLAWDSLAIFSLSDYEFIELGYGA
jgi:hypothetical protein